MPAVSKAISLPISPPEFPKLNAQMWLPFVSYLATKASNEPSAINIFSSQSSKLKSKQKEWKRMKREEASSSSGGGVVRQFLASASSSVADLAKTGLQEVGKGLAKGAVSSVTGVDLV